MLPPTRFSAVGRFDREQDYTRTVWWIQSNLEKFEQLEHEQQKQLDLGIFVIVEWGNCENLNDC